MIKLDDASICMIAIILILIATGYGVYSTNNKSNLPVLDVPYCKDGFVYMETTGRNHERGIVQVMVYEKGELKPERCNP